MDKSTLVDANIDDGQNLLAHLVAEGVPVTGAVWVKEVNNGRWYYYLITALVTEEGGKRPAYRRLTEEIRKMPQAPFWGDPFRIRVFSPSSPVGQALRELHTLYRGRLPARYDGYRLGNVSIEGAYLYPPVVAAEQQEAQAPAT